LIDMKTENINDLPLIPDGWRLVEQHEKDGRFKGRCRVLHSEGMGWRGHGGVRWDGNLPTRQYIVECQLPPAQETDTPRCPNCGSDTPRVDAELKRIENDEDKYPERYDTYIAMVDFARTLERENARLREALANLIPFAEYPCGMGTIKGMKLVKAAKGTLKALTP